MSKKSGGKKKRGKSTGDIVMISDNRKARFDYEILERVEAGLELLGSEVKSLRDNNGNINEAYIRFSDGQAYLVNSYIAPYLQAGPTYNHKPRRERRLLMKRGEIGRWASRVAEKGLSAVPLRIYFKKGWAKIELGMGRGRKQHDKRAAIREREDKKDMQKALKLH